MLVVKRHIGFAGEVFLQYSKGGELALPSDIPLACASYIPPGGGNREKSPIRAGLALKQGWVRPVSCETPETLVPAVPPWLIGLERWIVDLEVAGSRRGGCNVFLPVVICHLQE